jgi:release factor glutamine methyltransferase
MSAIVARLRAAGCVFAEDEARLLVAHAATADDLARLVARRVDGEPLEYVLGWAEFYGLRIAIDPGVFVPRHRTEFLVGQALAVTQPDAVVVDLCCGSGALGAAVQASIPSVRIHAADIDPVAVACARRNVPAAAVYCGDLYDALPGRLRGRIDVLLANVPYVPTGEIDLMPAEAREHEARVALDGGTDGLAVLARVAADAADWLAPGGSVFVETSRAQAPTGQAIFAAGRLRTRIVEDDDGASVLIASR